MSEVGTPQWLSAPPTGIPGSATTMPGNFSMIISLILSTFSFLGASIALLPFLTHNTCQSSPHQYLGILC